MGIKITNNIKLINKIKKPFKEEEIKKIPVIDKLKYLTEKILDWPTTDENRMTILYQQIFNKDSSPLKEFLEEKISDKLERVEAGQIIEKDMYEFDYQNMEKEIETLFNDIRQLEPSVIRKSEYERHGENSQTLEFSLLDIIFLLNWTEKDYKGQQNHSINLKFFGSGETYFGSWMSLKDNQEPVFYFNNNMITDKKSPKAIKIFYYMLLKEPQLFSYMIKKMYSEK